MKNLVLSVAAFALVSSSAMAAGHKAAWHCANAEGVAVEGIKTEKDCKAPNKVVKGEAATKSHTVETTKKTETTTAPAPAAQ